jgi:hypothetical protein
VLGELLMEVVNPIYSEHPDLKPEQMGGTYKLPPNAAGKE